MKVKIALDDLQMGMYVSELDRPWIETPFLFQGFELTAQEELEQLKRHCTYVYIDTELGIDLPPKLRAAAAVRTRILQEKDERLLKEFNKLVENGAPEAADGKKAYPDKTGLEQELPPAREIDRDAREMMHDVLDDAKQNQLLDLERTQRVVNNMVDSILRNPDALVCLSQLKEASLYTALHSVRSAILAIAFGRHLVLSRDELVHLGLGAIMHDIGMIRMPAELLDKPGAFTEIEFNVMKTHVPRGVSLVELAGFPEASKPYVAQHHERHDGSGYPYRLKEKQLSLFGAIGGIIDVYDALTSDAAHRRGMSAEDVLRRMYEWREKDFHARLVEEFIRAMGIFPIGSLVELNTGSVGVVVSINRARRLKPKVALVLTASKKPYTYKTITDMAVDQDSRIGELKINKVLPAGTHDINPMEHIVML